MNPQVKIPAVFMRGGTSKGVFFHQRDLPARRDAWEALFTAIIGSPDPYLRQLDGMGGGISSLSKIVVIGPPTRDDADVDYTFGQVAVDTATVDYGSNCGNLSSAVGPFALDEGLVTARGGLAEVRIHNTNTGKIIISRFPVENGLAAVDGDFEVAGVAGCGARVRLEFLDPGGAGTGQLLPTGKVIESLEVPGVGRLEASLVDATNPVVFIDAAALGLDGTEPPAALESDSALMKRFEAIRGTAAIGMGLAKSLDDATRHSKSSPKLALVTPPRDSVTLTGERIAAESMDVNVRMISMGQPHRAVPLTGALCMAVAARLEGSLVHRAARSGGGPDADLRIAHPSGIIPLAAKVRPGGPGNGNRAHAAGAHAEYAVAYRTARRLMEGAVLVPASRLPQPLAKVQ